MKKWLSFGNLLNGLTSLSAWMAVLCAIGIIGFTGVEILGRWVFNFTTKGSEEISSYMLIGITFLGAAYTFVEGGHIRIDLLYKRISPRLRNIVGIFHGIVGIIFCVAITYFSSNLVAQNIAFNSHSSSTWEVPLVIPSILIPIGMGILTLVMISDTIRRIRKTR